MAYNMRIYKYPSGTQVRMYSSPILQDIKNNKYDDNNLEDIYQWNDEINDYEISRIDYKRQWENPFTGKIEKAPKLIEDIERDRKRSFVVSASRSIQVIYNIARSNVWDWFFTLTFNPDKVERFDYKDCCEKLTNWIDRVRRVNPEMKYIFVPEKHKNGAFHFHGLVSGMNDNNFIDSGKRTKNGMIIYNIITYKLGFTTATRIIDTGNASSYLCKYITKDLTSSIFYKRRYWASRNVERVQPEEYLIEGKALKQMMKDYDEMCLFKKVKEINGNEVIYYEFE